jgi:lipid A ethanolaminephosphotransferase
MHDTDRHLNYRQPRITAPVLVLGASVFIAVAYNLKFWAAFVAATGGLSLSNLPLHVGCFVLLVLVFNGCLTLFSFRLLAKPLLVLLFMAAAATTYFMSQYGAVIDRSMIQNVLETDTHEALELLNWKMITTISLLGVLPSLAVLRAQVHFPAGRRALAFKAGNAAGSLALAVVLLLVFFKSLAPALREHRELRYLLTPTNYIQAVNGYLKARTYTPVVVAPLGTDARKGLAWAGSARRTVTVIVVGETARAMNFSLNGYARITNPLLSRQAGLLNFSKVQSCGTATAVSVPCVFSALGHDDYSDTQAHSQEGLLDVLAHAGFDVLWRDNNSGCKGACDRVRYEDFALPAAGDALCDGDECYDERMLSGLPALIRSATRDLVIVLHQKGSHGPAYAKRYPRQFGKFGPVCDTNELQKCSKESIVAAYDNTILYTDYFLSKTIDLLRATAAEEGVDTSMLYFSDHGESLGENNMYLHGAPWMIAPPEQTHVPLMLWMSDGFSKRFQIDRTCLAARAGQSFSHDNVFHSVLGMLNVNTAVFNPRLNLFGACTHGA